MMWRTPRSTLPYTLLPYTTLFRSAGGGLWAHDEPHQRAQPGTVGGGEARDIERERHFRILVQILDGELQHAPIEFAHEAEPLRDRHEGAVRNDRALCVDHTDQGFVVGHQIGRAHV